jgi:uncharacterized protein (TIGR02421 family)
MIEIEKEAEISDLVNKLKNGEGLHETFPGGSQVHIDRPLPFICIYRFPEGVKKTAHAHLVSAQPSFILMQAEDEQKIKAFLAEVSEILRKRFGALMLVEVWPSSDLKDKEEHKVDKKQQKDLFTLYCSQKECKVSLETMERELCEIAVVQSLPNHQIKFEEKNFPAERELLLDEELAAMPGMQYIGIEVQPFYYSKAQNRLYPMLFRAFRKQFSTALRKSFFDFVRLQTRHEVTHYHGLGRQKESDLVWKIDHELVEINNSFDFLLLVTPTNHEEEWEKFRRSNYSNDPTFQYRLIPVDPELLKRKLYNLLIEDIDDPTLAFLMRDKRDELDRMLNMLVERNTPHFKYSSIHVFGGVEDELYHTAIELLKKYPPKPLNNTGQKKDLLSAEEFAELARQEIQFLKGQYPALDATVQIRNDIEGLMVSKGQLLIDHHLKVSRTRAEALIQHEVGTHVLTFYNGKEQPLKQLYIGAPGYEDLQEGLAVLAEYLVGGLTRSRIRLLAARVVSVRCMLNGANFIENFKMMHQEYGFKPATAFSLVTRVYRGGGFTKDAVYLKGLVDLLKYLSSGKPLQPLLIGKIRQDYLPFIDELLKREILKPAPLRPRYFSNFESMEKLKKLKAGATVFDLLKS